MKQTMIKRILPLLLAAVLGLALTACGSASASDGAEVRQVVVGTGNAYKPFCFLDESGELVGFEIDILNRVDELLPQYVFSFETAEFKSILIGMDAGKYDIAAHNYARNEEREQNYLYGLVPYGTYAYQIVVKTGNERNIREISDLEGLTVACTAGNNVSFLLETYNETAGTPIEVAYGSYDTETIVKGLEEGRFDAHITTVRNITEWRETYNNAVEGVGEELLPGYTYYLFAKGDEALRDDVDAVIAQLRESGELSEIALRWFDKDYSQLIDGLER